MVKILAMTTVNPEESDALAVYMNTVLPLVESVGGKLIERYEVGETIVGESSPKFVSIIEYPNEAAVRGVFQSTEHTAITDIRNQAFSSYTICFLS